VTRDSYNDPAPALASWQDDDRFLSRPHPSAFVAGTDAPPIGERAAARARWNAAISTPVEKAPSRSSAASRSLANKIERRERRSVGGDSTKRVGQNDAVTIDYTGRSAEAVL
jgi:hypothetical protein